MSQLRTRYSLAVIALAAGFLLACEQSTAPDPGDPVVTIAPAALDQLDATQREQIARDAAVLALRDMHRDSLRMVRDIPIDPVLLRLYEQALAHVALAERIPASDSVRGIPVHPMPVTHGLILSVELQAAWVGAWVSGGRFTGFAPVDDLLSAWDLHVQSISRLYATPSWMVVLESAAPLNIRALAESFRGIRGIRFADPNGIGGDGPDITATRDESGVTLHYSIGWGDCPSGCISRHGWTFHVSRIGAVTLRAITGPNLPFVR